MRNNNQKRRNAIIAAALGAALLMGGGTFALWSASAGLTDVTISSGTLSIERNPELAAVYDMSPDSFLKASEADEGTPVYTIPGPPSVQKKGFEFSTTQLNTFLAVPGDTIAFKNSYEMLIQGNNLKANLELDVKGLFTGAFALNPDEWTVSYLLATGGNYTGTPTDIDSSKVNDGTIVLTTTPLTEINDSIGVLVLLSFNKSAESPEGMNQPIDLTAASDNFSLVLKQYRP